MQQAVLEQFLKEFSAGYADRRMQVCELHIASFSDERLALSGKVLDAGQLEQLRAALQSSLPAVELDFSQVRVLRQAAPRLLYVNTNLAGVFAQPGWLSEMLTQCTFGTALEVLDEQEHWVFTRQLDGYLGWLYRPYLTEMPAPAPTYVVSAPVSLLHSEPNSKSLINSRVPGGTLVQVVSTCLGWAEVDANRWGWLSMADLRPLDGFHPNPEELRKTMVSDALRMVGVMYLWGGSTVYGIDCSGFSQLIYRWSGINIPRDADMQYEAARKIEPPYRPGDLLFFSEGGSRKVSHVAISLGDWRIIHASRARNGVYVDDLEQEPALRQILVGAGTFL